MIPTLPFSNGLSIPVLGFGTYQIEGDACEKSVLDAIEIGYRLIDTAQCYGNEAEVGRAISACGVPREELFITTKIDFPYYDSAREIVENSLKLLQVDYLDLVMLHWPFGNYYHAWREMEKLHDEKVIRSLGISNFEADRFIDLIHFNRVKPVINQIETNLYCQRFEERKWMDKYDIRHQAYSPLGQGLRNDMFENPDLKQIAEKHGKTPVQVALRYLTQLGISVIPKTTHKERMIENFKIFDFELNAEEMQKIKRMDQSSPDCGKPEDPELAEIAMTW